MKEDFKIKKNVFKRSFDIIFSLIVLILFSPLYLLISILIYITSSSPIFYGHERVGRRNKKIKCWKFRTMVKDADKKLADLLNDKKNKEEWKKFYKLKNDPRILPFGKFLRKTSLDELPQFFNVLMGDLSIVGPRPCVEKEILDNFKEKSKKILSVRPGITGMWPTSGRNNLTIKERIELEEKYIDEYSFFLDIKLILKTIPLIFSFKGVN